MSPYRIKFFREVTIKKIKRYVKTSLVSVVILVLLFLLLNWIFPLPDKIEYSTIITDNKGIVIHAFLTRDEQWRMKTTLEEISPLLRKTIIQKEDRHFYNHPGVNPVAMTRAFFKNIFRGKRTSGASTITMQVARALEPKSRTYGNKLVEAFRALQLEMKYSKDEILQLYLNLLPYGGNIQGVKSASILYFGKNPDHLSLAEITALSIIPNRPSTLVIGKSNDEIIKERNRWLKIFAKEKVFTSKEIEDALQEPLTAQRGTVPRFIPHLAYKLKQQHGTDIIHTNIRMNEQMKIEKLVEDYVRTLSLKNIHNASVVVVDNQTHEIISYAGSANFYDTTDGGQVNGAAAIRQPGSTLKPLLYGLCFDEGLLTPKMMMTDVAINYAGYAPENYDRNFNGYVTAEFSLENSLNIPAVKGLRMLGKDRFVTELMKCDFKQVKKDRQKLGLSMILGGCGTTLEELTGLYSAFANEGVWVKPVFVSERPVGNGKKDLKNRSPLTTTRSRILSPASTFMINEILSRINRPDFPLTWQSTEHLPKIAWKTGTSYGRRDAWSIGYNKKYTVGVWVGNFSGVGVPDLSGATTATPLLFKIFNTIDYDSDQEWFTQPNDCELRMVCSETGLVPAEHCTNIVSDYFIPLISSATPCNNIQEVMISEDEKISYCKTCAPETGYKKKSYKFLSADIQSYFDEKNIAYQRVPLHNPGCEKIFKEGVPVITFPVNGSEYFINKKDPEPLQLTCQTGNDVQQVYWYINNKFYKSSGAKSKQFFVPDEGPVKISCTDDKGRNRDIWIKVKYVRL
jgi:penicillin-binding protein 1C